MTDRVFDCFMVFNELDLLKIRMEILNSVVDFFVIVEAKQTFSGKAKPLFFKENIELFKKYFEKIIYFCVDSFPDNIKDWEREKINRNAMLTALKNWRDEFGQGIKDNDVIIVSDLDEIPRPSIVDEYLQTRAKDIWNCQCVHFEYYLNYINIRSPRWRKGPKIVRYSVFNCEFKRIVKYPIPEDEDGVATPNKIRHCIPDVERRNSGWHFSSLGGSEKIKYKLKSISDHGGKIGSVTQKIDELDVSSLINQGKCIFGRWYFNKYVALQKDMLHKYWPEYLIEKDYKYVDLIAENPIISKYTMIELFVFAHGLDIIRDFLVMCLIGIRSIGESMGIRLIKKKF